jgi:hypothetical protein
MEDVAEAIRRVEQRNGVFDCFDEGVPNQELDIRDVVFVAQVIISNLGKEFKILSKEEFSNSKFTDTYEMQELLSPKDYSIWQSLTLHIAMGGTEENYEELSEFRRISSRSSEIRVPLIIVKGKDSDDLSCSYTTNIVGMDSHDRLVVCEHTGGIYYDNIQGCEGTKRYIKKEDTFYDFLVDDHDWKSTSHIRFVSIEDYTEIVSKWLKRENIKSLIPNEIAPYRGEREEKKQADFILVKENGYLYFKKSVLLEWMEEKQASGQFRGLPEADMDFRTLSDEDLKSYHAKWTEQDTDYSNEYHREGPAEIDFCHYCDAEIKETPEVDLSKIPETPGYYDLPY